MKNPLLSLLTLSCAALAVAVPNWKDTLHAATGPYIVLNSSKNVVTQTSSTSCYVTDGKAAGKFKQKAVIKPTTSGFAALGGVIEIRAANDIDPGTGAVGDIVHWTGDMLLEQQFGSPTVTPVDLKGKVAAVKGANAYITFDKDTANPDPLLQFDNELKMATALNQYHASVFNDLFENAALDPAGAKKAAPYVMKLNLKNGQMNETSFITSSDGPCTSSAKIVRKYRPE